ncbi:MAG: MarR family transcriptional regulator [Ignavibacteriales bacterium]|nr:MarR family transcriptional regulator [Ignavibacteriales bacterium]
MARKSVTARAERIIRILPKIMGSIAHWHHDRMVMGINESGRIDRPIGDLKISGGKGVKLTFNQYQALTAIRELGECSVNDLADRLGIAQSTTSQLVDRLVKGGFVGREIFAGDRRRMIVTLSKSGAQIMERRKQSLLQTYTRILLMLNENDQEMLEDAFEKFYRVTAKLNRSSTKHGV